MRVRFESCLTLFADLNQECNLPLGVTSVNSNDSKILWFSFHDWDTIPTKAKLNSPGGYRARKSDPENYKFVRVTFTKETILTGVATQGFGDPSVDEWVTKYIVGVVRMTNGEKQKQDYINDTDGRPKVKTSLLYRDHHLKGKPCWKSFFFHLLLAASQN